jgi:hypothetical protein
LWVAAARYLFSCPAAPQRHRPSKSKTPVANLCNRLVVNEHLPDRSTLERWALAVSTTASGPAADCTHPRAHFDSNTVFDGVELPQAANPTPSSATGWRLLHWL